MKRILAAISQRGATGDRDRAMYAAIYRGAMRIGATLRLKPADIDWEHQLIRIYKDKGGKSRTIALDGKTFDLLRTWSKQRTRLGISDDAPFFCGCAKGARGNPLTEQNRLFRFQCYARKAGITRHVNLHLLRHTGASELLEEGFDVPTISRVLGHVSLLTTYKYLHELRPDLMNVKLTQREW